MIYKKEELVFVEKPKDKRFKDIEGQKFNQLTVLGYAGYKKIAGRMRPHWFAECDCVLRNVIKVYGTRLRIGHTKSCGCLAIEVLYERNVTHDQTGSHEFKTYHGAKGRCTNPNDTNYKNYGARGIKFLYTSLEQFIEDVGLRPSDDHSIDRIDVNSHYEVGNCRWATRKEQANNKRNTIYLEFNDETKSLLEWCEIYKIQSSVVRDRLKVSNCLTCVLTTPVNSGWRSAKCEHN